MKANSPTELSQEIQNLWLNLQELEAGTITPEARQSLMDLLSRSEEARDAYLEYFELSAMLTEEAKIQSEISSMPCACEAPEQQASSVRVIRFPKTFWMAAAAVLIFALGFKFFLTPEQSKPFMKLAAVPGSEYTIDGKTEPADRLAEGSTITVTSGTVKLQDTTGADLIIQGPATVAFPKLNQPFVKEGWLWIDTENDHHPFQVTTPELLIQDIGTRFGVHVPAKGPAVLHLLEGQIDAYSRTDNRKLISLIPEDRAFAIDAEGETTGLTLSPDPFLSIEPLLTRSESYETTILSQSPTGYWQLDDMSKKTLTNLSPEGAPARFQSAALNSTPGPENQDGHTRFTKNNRALKFSGADVWAPLSLGSAPFHNEILFKEDFSSVGKLHGHQPSISMDGIRWIATPAFNRNGNIDPKSTGTATLPFTPVNGVVYTLDASFQNLSAHADFKDAWVALAFSTGQGISSKLYGRDENRFLEGQTTGRAWMMFRATQNDKHSMCYLGTTGKNGGEADAAAWTNWNTGHGGDIDMRIVLDTTRGAGHWTSTWFAKRPNEKEYIMVRPSTELINEAINSIGIGVGKQSVSGTIQSFSLTAAAKNPQGHQEHLSDASSTINREEGAVSFWIKPELTGTTDQIVWTAGNSPSDDSMHLRISPAGDVKFFIENDRYDLLVQSESALIKETWQHLAVVWSPDHVAIFLNGKPISFTENSVTMPTDTLPEFYFGSGPLDSRFAPFTGSIDEIAVWQRALSATEIKSQYQAAGEKKDR